MWPLSYKQGIKKVRSYKKSNNKKRTIDDVNEDDEPKLSRLPLSGLIEIWDTVMKVKEFGNRDPIKFSNNLREVFKVVMISVDL
jgi:hypothetical protein